MHIITDATHTIISSLVLIFLKKSQDYIHDFFQKNNGKEFIGICKEESLGIIHNRTAYFYPFQHFLNAERCIGIGRQIAKFQGAFVALQKLLKIRRSYSMPLRMGSNWFSVTNDFVEYLLSYKDVLEKEFNHILISDEIAIQSLFWNSRFKENIFDHTNVYASCLRFVDWNRGNPYTWQDHDFDELINSNFIFARKFSSRNMEIVKKLKEYIQG